MYLGTILSRFEVQYNVCECVHPDN